MKIRIWRAKKKSYKNNQDNFENKDNYNIYRVINILKKEQLYNKNIIESIKNLDIFNNIPIFIIYKYYFFLIY